jgi:hypothetical protein
MREGGSAKNTEPALPVLEGPAEAIEDLGELSQVQVSPLKPRGTFTGRNAGEPGKALE